MTRPFPPKSRLLYDLAQSGKLKKPLKKLKNCDPMGYGTQVYCYAKSSKYVLKLAPLSISSVVSMGTVEAFKKKVDTLSEYFSPIKKIIYLDKYSFIYKQERCTHISLGKNNAKQLSEYVIDLCKFMLRNNAVVCDLGTHNIGLYKGHYKLFDFHGIKTVDTFSHQLLLININKFINVLGMHIDTVKEIYGLKLGKLQKEPIPSNISGGT
jgi:hypothetical protein